MKTPSFGRLNGLTVVSGVAALSASAAAQTYRITDLGSLGGQSGALGLSRTGIVVGASTTGSADFHAFAWDGSMRDVGTLPGDAQSVAFDCDDAGRVLGASYSLGALKVHAFLAAPKPSALGDFSPRAMNDAGTIVGSMLWTTEGLWFEHACRLEAGVLTELPTLGGRFAYGSDIDGAGRIVGTSALAGDSVNRACVWVGGVAKDLGTLGGSWSEAYAINDAGQVAGVSATASGDPHAFIFQIDGAGAVTGRTDLPVLGNRSGYALAINGAGQVVGTSGARAVLWTGGIVLDLNTAIPSGSGWVMESAGAISDAGLIAGRGYHSGMPHAFLLTPDTCRPDCNGDGKLNINDFICFQAKWRARDPYGDYDASGTFTINDFIRFQADFVRGCP